MYTVVIPIKDEESIADLTFNEEHLLTRKLKVISKIEAIDQIIINTNSAFIIELINHGNYSNVVVCERSQSATECFSDLVKETCAIVKNKQVIWVFITTPFNDYNVISNAIRKYESLDFDIYDSLVTCTRLNNYIFDENGPINFHQGRLHSDSKDLPLIYKLSNKVFIMSKEYMNYYEYPWGKIPYKYLIDYHSAMQISEYNLNVKYIKEASDD